MKLTFRSKFNQVFANHSCLRSAFWKALFNFKIKRAQEARYNQLVFQNVFLKKRFLRCSKCSKTTIKLTFTTHKSNACSPWIICSVFDWKYWFYIEENLIQKCKIVCAKWNLIQRLIWIRKMEWWCLFYLF